MKLFLLLKRRGTRGNGQIEEGGGDAYSEITARYQRGREEETPEDMEGAGKTDLSILLDSEHISGCSMP